MNKTEGVKLAMLQQEVIDLKENNTSDHTDIKNVLTRIEIKLDNKTDQVEFIFWRNLLVSGILIGILLGIIALLFGR